MVACTRFRRHRVRCFDGTGGEAWRGGSLHESSSLRLCGWIKDRGVSYAQASHDLSASARATTLHTQVVRRSWNRRRLLKAWTHSAMEVTK